MIGWPQTCVDSGTVILAVEPNVSPPGLAQACSRGRRVRCNAVFCGTVLFGIARMVHAEDSPHVRASPYSAYEMQAIHSAELRLGVLLDEVPEGKVIESIELVRLDPIEERDPAPQWLNLLHTRTQKFVIRRELLLREQGRYERVLAEESARNLRALPQFSLALVLALRGTQPDRVRVVVLTKDGWSLFVDFDLTGASHLHLAPQESNLLGLHHQATLAFNLDPKTFALGLHYEIHRFAGSGIHLLGDGNVVHDRAGNPAGSFGKVSAVQPLLTARSTWSWFDAVSWTDREHYDFENGRVLTADYNCNGDTRKCEAQIAHQWHELQLDARAALVHSSGWRLKSDFIFYADVQRSSFVLPASARTVPIAALLAFESTIMPTSSTNAGPGLEWHGYTSNFLRTHDLETLGLEEDYRLGPNALAGISPRLHSEQFSRGGFPDQARYRALELHSYVVVQETLALDDGLLRASVSGFADDAWTSQVSGPQAGDPELRERMKLTRLRNVTVVGRVHLATPRLGFGRFVEDLLVTERAANALNQTQSYGGDNRLRIKDATVSAASTAVANFEYRSPACQISTEQVGLVAFFDAASAIRERELAPSPGPFADVGLGLRIVTPLLERAGFRVDVGMPVHGHARPHLALAFGQAFSIDDVTPFGP